MRAFAILLLVTACTEHGQTPSGPPPLPVECDNACVIEPGAPFIDCCDTVTCFLDPETNTWLVAICDDFPDPDPCLACTSDQICVQSYDGTCGVPFTACVDPPVECPEAVCNPACDDALCGGITTCAAAPCGTESPIAFGCYGP